MSLILMIELQFLTMILFSVFGELICLQSGEKAVEGFVTKGNVKSNVLGN